MKKNIACISFFSLAILCLLAFSTFYSCRRNKKCDLIVNVTNGATNGPVVGATVHVYPNQTNANGNLKDQDQTATTDASGVARFTFKLPAILAADVTPPAPLAPAATRLVKLEEGKSVSVAIKVY